MQCCRPLEGEIQVGEISLRRSTTLIITLNNKRILLRTFAIPFRQRASSAGWPAPRVPPARAPHTTLPTIHSTRPTALGRQNARPRRFDHSIIATKEGLLAETTGWAHCRSSRSISQTPARRQISKLGLHCHRSISMACRRRARLRSKACFCGMKSPWR